MTRIRFVGPADGAIEVEAAPGARLLDVAQAAGMPLEGTCGGDMACATCHVILAADAFARLPAASVEEEDLLDLVAGAVRTSRLSCQLVISDGDPMSVTIPAHR